MLFIWDGYVVLFMLYLSSEDEDDMEFFDVDEYYDLGLVLLRLVWNFLLVRNYIYIFSC